MVSDHFQNQITWVQGLTGDDKKKAGSAVAWQCVMTTLNELVRHFNEVTFSSDEPTLKHNREVQLKKVLIGMLFEVVDTLNHWTGVLREDGLFDDQIKEKKVAFEDAYKRVGVGELKKIRDSIAFHYTKSLTDPDAIVDLLTRIDQIPLSVLNDIIKEANFCGLAMRDKVVRNIR